MFCNILLHLGIEHLKHLLDFLKSTFSFNLQTLLVSLIL